MSWSIPNNIAQYILFHCIFTLVCLINLGFKICFQRFACCWYETNSYSCPSILHLLTYRNYISYSLIKYHNIQLDLLLGLYFHMSIFLWYFYRHFPVPLTPELKPFKFSFWPFWGNFHFCTCLPTAHLFFYSHFTETRTTIYKYFRQYLGCLILSSYWLSLFFCFFYFR